MIVFCFVVVFVKKSEITGVFCSAIQRRFCNAVCLL